MSLTTNDLKLIKDVMRSTIDQALDENETFARKDDVKHLPTKEEFFASEDRLMGELKAVREEMTMLSDMNRKVNDHDDRIAKVEKKLGIQSTL